MSDSRPGRRLGALLTLVGLGACAGGVRDEAAAEAASHVVEGVAPTGARGVPSVLLLHALDGAFPPIGDASTGPPVVMDQFAVQFTPRVLLVRPGQRVAFTNSDESPHVVTVRTEARDSTLLDEVTDVGARIEHTFDRVGAYDVSCGMHPAMAGVVIVHEAAYATVAAQDGRYALRGVPAGTYRLEVWSAAPERRRSDTIQVGEGTTTIPPR